MMTNISDFNLMANICFSLYLYNKNEIKKKTLLENEEGI